MERLILIEMQSMTIVHYNKVEYLCQFKFFWNNPVKQHPTPDDSNASLNGCRATGESFIAYCHDSE